MLTSPFVGEGGLAEVLARWIDALESNHVLMGPREGVAAALQRWLDLFFPATEGDRASAHELYKLVAFHARGLGADGRPASAALMQVLLLEDALGAKSERTASEARELKKIVADAHALGASERAKNRHHLEIRDFSPVVRLGDKTILGFLLGAMESDLIDAMTGRLLREAARSGADHVILDCFGAARDNDTFHRTVQAFLRHEIGCRVTLTLSGIRDVDGTRSALLQLGCNMERVRFEPDVNSAISAALTR